VTFSLCFDRVLIVVDEVLACGDVDEGCLLDLGCCWHEGSRCCAFVNAIAFEAILPSERRFEWQCEARNFAC